MDAAIFLSHRNISCRSQDVNRTVRIAWLPAQVYIPCSQNVKRHKHDIMGLKHFSENTRHMIIFDVLSHSSPVGNKGERMRLFLSDIGYQKALENQSREEYKILKHAKVSKGDIFYERPKEAVR